MRSASQFTNLDGVQHYELVTNTDLIYAGGTDAVEPAPRRRARIRTYVALFAGVLIANAALFGWGLGEGWWHPHASSLQVIAAISQVNILFSILPRQH